MLVPILLAGGTGTRLWPLSRQTYPKQFLPLAGDDSLMQQTLKRLVALDDTAEPIIIGNQEHRFLIAEELRQANTGGSIILEPAGRNTAAAAAAGALEAIARHGSDCQLLILPSDHEIDDDNAFLAGIQRARTPEAAHKLVAFGIEPTRPDTAYGYIRTGVSFSDTAFEIAEFVEKPNKETSESYLAHGGYYWNSGIFLFGAQAYLDALAEHAPDIHEHIAIAHKNATRDMDFLRLESTAFTNCRSDSIDYAVMEHTNQAIVEPIAPGWSDLGSWSALADASTPDDNGNVCKGDVVVNNTDNCLVYSTSRLVTAIGVKDQIIIETGDAVMVVDKSRDGDVKALVEQLRSTGRNEATHHKQTYRPWGSYEEIAIGNRYKVKHIRVRPGGKLSLQRHHHRAEHWVVVNGTALVTRGDEEWMLTEDESTYIPLGTVHRLENPGKINLDLIEVQSGSYLGEDDIVRLDDVYGRSPIVDPE